MSKLKRFRDLALEIKEAYESLPNTNNFSDSDKQKLNNSVISDVNEIPGAKLLSKVYRISQADYDALPASVRNDESIGFIIND